MGIASAMNTALTGLDAAETQLDVAGNNLANSQTVGFKASEAIFATQFMRTLSQGSAPNNGNGGTNPMQVGMGVQTAEITPDFSQGTIEISTSSSDLAIEGDGFFIVQGAGGEQLYTRNGIFKTNSENELVSATGERVLGFGIDDSFQVQNSALVPITVPLGSLTVTQETTSVFLEGNLAPDGDVAEIAEVVDSGVLGDGLIPRPDVNDPAGPTRTLQAAVPDTAGTTSALSAGTSGFLAGDQFEYTFAFIDGNGKQTTTSISPIGVTIGANNDQVTLNGIPASPLTPAGAPEYGQVAIYRRKLGVPASDPQFDFKQIGTAAQGAASFSDNGIAPGTLLDTTALTGSYSYVVTFSGPGVPESRPSEVLGPVNVVNGRIHVDDLPSLPTPGGGVPSYTTINIYRNIANDSNSYFLVDSVSPGTDYTDGRSDAAISDLSNSANRALDRNGPPISTGTLLTNILKTNGSNYEQVFPEGTLTFKGTKGDVDLTPKTFDITTSSTIAELLQFVTSAMGIQASDPTDPNPIPESLNTITGSGTLAPGATVTSDGRIRIVGNNGTANAIEIKTDAFELIDSSGSVSVPNLAFGSVQEATGEGVGTNFTVYDSLGIPLQVRLTTALESRDGDSVTYRWFADSGENDPTGNDTAIAVGTGLVTFDSQGNQISSDGTQVTILRDDIPSSTPLTFDLNFSQVSGVATDSELSASRQDGSPPGTLTSFTVGGDGVVRGIFSNGVFRDLGQIRLARFSNPTGLAQRGRNMFSQSVNSGLPITGNPGDLGIGRIVAGARELSNTDVGENLIRLILSTTMYRSNSRVISTAQEMLDELLNLR